MKSVRILPLDEALDLIGNGAKVVASMAAAEPEALLGAIGQHCRSLRGVTLHCANPSREYPCFSDAALLDRLDLKVMFLTPSVRRRHTAGRVAYVPQHLSQWVRNLLQGGPVDVFWGSCTVPDERGFVSLGPGCCYEPEILRAAKVVVLEINSRLPLTSGATSVPISAVTAFVQAEHELPVLGREVPGALDHRIAAQVAELVADHSTIQLGIGGIPNAIGEALASKRDLGVHTEMINDTIMDLYLRGVVTGRYKSIWPGKMVGTFAYGTRKLYDFLDGHPAVELQPASVVNDPYRIGRNLKMVSINTAVEIDLTGQVCSESVGHEELSGVGGAADTHVGAQRSNGGRGIIAMRSKAKDGRSKIVFELLPGAKVSISRNDVDTVVTEHGTAILVGKSVSERVKSLIAVAAPEFRERLLAEARQVSYV